MPGPDSKSAWLMVASPNGPQSAARLATTTIFGLDENLALPAEDILCVRSGPAKVVCSDGDPATARAIDAATLAEQGQGHLDLAGVPHLVLTWALPLQAEYHAACGRP